MAFVKLVVFGFLALSVVYLCISLYSRSVRREKLEDEWDETRPNVTTDDARETFIAEGMELYENGMRRKLILLVFVVPPIVVMTIIFFVN